MRRLLVCAGLMLASIWRPAWSADVNLESLEKPSQWQQAMEMTQAIQLFLALGLDERQLADLTQRLAAVATAQKTARKEETAALLKAKDALKAKWEALLSNKEPAKEIDQQVEDALILVAAARANVDRAKRDALAGFIATLADWQKAMIRPESGGADAVEREKLLAQARQEHQRLMQVIMGLLRPTMERLLFLRNQQDYLRMRGGIAAELLDGLARQRLVEPNSPQGQEYVMRLFDVFDVVRRMTPQEYEQNEPAVVQLMLRALDIQTGLSLPAEPIITESALRDLLLRDSTLALAQERIKALQTRPAGGVR